MFIQINQKQKKAFLKVLNHYRESIRRRGASKTDYLTLIPLETIEEEILNQKKLFKDAQLTKIGRHSNKTK